MKIRKKGGSYFHWYRVPRITEAIIMNEQYFSSQNTANKSTTLTLFTQNWIEDPSDCKKTKMNKKNYWVWEFERTNNAVIFTLEIIVHVILKLANKL